MTMVCFWSGAVRGQTGKWSKYWFEHGHSQFKKRYGTVSEKRYDFSQMAWSQAFRFKDHSQLNLDHYQVDHDYKEGQS
jgi:hypothetical protein